MRRSHLLAATAVLPLYRSASAAEPLTLKMVGPRYIGVAPLYLGIQKGFFEQQGLKIDLATEQDTASTAAAMESGALDIGFISTTSLIRAISNGLKLRAIAPVEGIIDPKDPHPQVGLLVKDSSSIKRLRDFNGKTVAVPTLNSGLHMETKFLVDRDGGDSKSVNFSQLPFSAQGAALNAGRIDVIANSEPYKTQILAAGARAIAFPERDVMASAWTVAWCVAESATQTRRDMVTRFMKANAMAMTYAAKHLDEARAVIPTIVPAITADQAKTIPLGTLYVPTLDLGTVRRTVELLEKYGGLTNAPDPRNVVYTG